MKVSQVSLALFYIVSFLNGFGAGALYHLIHLFIPEFDPNCKTYQKIMSHITDFLFVTVCGICIIITGYRYNNGKIRLLSPMLFAIGFFIYRLTLGKPVSSIVKKIRKTTQKFFAKIIGSFSKPDIKKPERRKNAARKAAKKNNCVTALVPLCTKSEDVYAKSGSAKPRIQFRARNKP